MDIIKNDFKTIQLVCYHSAIDTKESRVYRYLLSKLIVSHTNEYTTKLAMSVRLEALYGALLSARSELNGNINTLSISLTIADPKIVGDDTLLKDAIAFFKAIIYDHDQFDESIFNDEKRLLVEQWQSLKDHKSAYAKYQFSKLFRLPDLSGYPLSGTLKDIKKATPQGLLAYYQDVFLKGSMHLVINGNIESIEIENILSSKNLLSSPAFQTTFRKAHKLKEVVEETDMKQAMIKMGYVFPIYRFDENYESALLANLILGGYPESRLFKIIREKENLCYDVSSNYDVYKGTVTVGSGVAIDMCDIAKKSMIELVEDLKTNGITDDELKTAKTYISHQIKAGLDHQSYFTKRAYYAYLTTHDEPIESRLKRIENVTIETVNKALKSLFLDTIYVLKGVTS